MKNPGKTYEERLAEPLPRRGTDSHHRRLREKLSFRIQKDLKGDSLTIYQYTLIALGLSACYSFVFFVLINAGNYEQGTGDQSNAEVVAELDLSEPLPEPARELLRESMKVAFEPIKGPGTLAYAFSYRDREDFLLEIEEIWNPAFISDNSP